MSRWTRISLFVVAFALAGAATTAFANHRCGGYGYGGGWRGGYGYYRAAPVVTYGYAPVYSYGYAPAYGYGRSYGYGYGPRYGYGYGRPGINIVIGGGPRYGFRRW